jgi:hypothetical protein
MAARMSGSWLHAGFTLAAAMPVLVLEVRVWNISAWILAVFRHAMLTFIAGRFGTDCGGLPRLVFLHHGQILPGWIRHTTARMEFRCVKA